MIRKKYKMHQREERILYLHAKVLRKLFRNKSEGGISVDHIKTKESCNNFCPRKMKQIWTDVKTQNFISLENELYYDNAASLKL